MKKLLKMLLMAVTALCLALPAAAAEAATIALLPLVNTISDDLAGQVYYKEALAIINSRPGYLTVENEELTAAITAAGLPGRMPTESELAAIAAKGHVDIVIGFELDKLKSKTRRSTEERVLILDLQGKAFSYNALTGLYTNRTIKPSLKVPEATTSRFDWRHEEWGRQVRLETAKILDGKK